MKEFERTPEFLFTNLRTHDLRSHDMRLWCACCGLYTRTELMNQRCLYPYVRPLPNEEV